MTEKTNVSNTKKTTLWICTTALFMAMNVALSSFGVPVPGGHLYLNDIIICTAAILLDPLAAFMVGGVGAFLGDFFFYPTHVCVSCDPRTSGRRDFAFCPSCDEKTSRRRLGNRRGNRSRYHGCGLFSRPRVYIQHPPVCNRQAALSDSSGGCGSGFRYAALLEMRPCEVFQNPSA